MDILLQFQSAKRNKIVYGCVENVPVHTLSRALTDLDFTNDLLRALSLFEEDLNDCFYIAGIIDRSFCNRKVALTVTYDYFRCHARGLGEASSIV